MMLVLVAWRLALTLAASGVADATPVAVEPFPPAMQERYAILILPDRGTAPSLAENLTEVVLARVAERQRGQLVGTAEFRRRLGIEDDARASACLDELACLGRAGVALGVRRVVTGTIRQEGSQYYLNIMRTDLPTGKIEGRFFRLVQGTEQDLVAAAQEGTDDLFRLRPEPGRLRIDSMLIGSRVNVDGLYVGTTPMVSSPLTPGLHAVRVEHEGYFSWATRVKVVAATDLQIKLLPEQMPRRRQWPTAVFTGAVASAVLALGFSATLGTLSELEPSGSTRRAVQQDVARHQTFATYANAGFGVSAIFAITAVVIRTLYRADIGGE